MQIIIERAIDRYDLAHEFFIHHKRILAHHKVSGISSMSPKWKYNPNVFLFLVIDDRTNTLAAGMRLEVSNPTSKVPFQEALEKSHPSVNQLIRDHQQNGGLAELSGLWVNPAYSKMDLPKKMTQAGIDQAKKLGLSHVVAFANKYSRPIVENMGFEVTPIDHCEVFFYPDERYSTYLMKKTLQVAKITRSTTKGIVSRTDQH